MKVSVGPHKLTIFDKTHPILDNTLGIIKDYTNDLEKIRQWHDEKIKFIETEYESKLTQLVTDTERRLNALHEQEKNK